MEGQPIRRLEALFKIPRYIGIGQREIFAPIPYNPLTERAGVEEKGDIPLLYRLYRVDGIIFR